MKNYQVRPGSKVDLREWKTDDTSGSDGKKQHGNDRLAQLRDELEPLQELLYAGREHSVLVVLQGMDSAGKDGTIRRVFEGVNPQGVRVAQFRVPTALEASHDFLWRIHPQLPAKGEIVIFNRSHYEDVLVTRVHRLVPEAVWHRRFREINEFEQMVVASGTIILKFFLHLGEEEQKLRLKARLDDRTKHWKFSAGDAQERKLWPKYMRAYQEAVEQTSTAWAPWYIVPSDRKWFRDLLVCTVLVDALKSLRMKYPPLPLEFKGERGV
ncbi:MAG: polyphosphate kinase 2 family protein [Thermoplasmata archaeon]|nr:polyphosphate kinase 2 family protein [Thermoplasmata archaeon]